MSVSQKKNIAYSLNQPLAVISQEPIISVRNPTTSDKAPLGTLWVNKVSNDGFIITSIVNNSATWIGIGGGPGTFTDLTVTGTALFEGAFTVESGTNAINIGTDLVAKTINIGSATGATAVDIVSGTGDTQITSAADITLTTQSNSATSFSVLALSGGVLIDSKLDMELVCNNNDFIVNTGTGSINIGTDATSKVITIGTGTGATQLELVSGTGGLILNGDGLVTVVPVTDTIASPLVTATENFNVIRLIFSGFTTAIGASETFIINSNKISTTSGILVQLTNTDATATGAILQTTGVIQGNGNIHVIAENVGTGALNGNIIVTVWVIS